MDGLSPTSGAMTSLQRLVETGIQITAGSSLESVIERAVEGAAALTGARYAALGVRDVSGKSLEHFVTAGLDEGAIRGLGPPPEGHGVLGVLVTDGRPIRVHDLTVDPRSVGIPAGHPPARTFLGVPITVRGVTSGSLYLTEKEGGLDFTDDDEGIALALAGQVGLAIENARLHESKARWMRLLESITEVSNALAAEYELSRLLELVAARLRDIVGARSVFLALPTPDGNLRIEAAVDDRDLDAAVGLVFRREGSKCGRVFDRRQSDRVDSVADDTEIDQAGLREYAARAGIPLPSSGIYTPLVIQHRAIGVVVAHDKVDARNPADLRFSDEDVHVAEVLASRAAVAVDLSARVQRDVLRRVVEAQDLERQRIALELHGSTGQALTSLLLGLRAVENTGDDSERGSVLASLRDLASTTLQDVRRIAVDLWPKALEDFGLSPALERLAENLRERTGLQTDIEISLKERLQPEIEATLYRVIQDALTSLARRAGMKHASVTITRRPFSVTAVIEEDGNGLAADAELADDSPGLAEMRERAAQVGGRLSIERSRRGTTIVIEVPLP